MIITNLLPTTPLVLATAILVVAAGLKAGKERGAVLAMLGALGLLFAAIVVPLFYQVVWPRIIEGLDIGVQNTLWMTIRVIQNLFTGASMLLIALSFFLRPTSAPIPPEFKLERPPKPPLG